jgi:hypothetical protein
MMSLEQLLQASLPAKLEESKPVGPALLVGLGGTGKEVLLRFRRLVAERYGALSALPFIQFMHLDTDSTVTAREQYDLKSGEDPLYDEIKFRPAERVDLTIEGGTGKYTQHINSYPQIKRWFSTTGKLAGLGNLGEGAGQVRMASRLGFFHPPNFTKITSRIEQCKGLLRDASIPKRAAELGFDLFDAQGMSIFIITSIAGGTGGGTFLDAGFLLQRHFPNSSRLGILLLPAFFKDYAGGERVRANGYAALMELNHYSFGHAFRADWDGSRPENLLPPPFTNTYLIDGTNEAGLVIGSSGKEFDAYQMIAEFLFQDYSIGKFAGMKRATRVNLVNFNINVYTHNFLNDQLRVDSQSSNKTVVGDTFPTRFGSFGLATISYPTARLHNAAAARLAGQILEFWQKTLLDNPLEKLFTTFLVHPEVAFAQGRYERRDGGGILDHCDVEDALLWFDAASGKTFQSYLSDKALAARSEIEASPRGQKAAILAAHRSQLEQLLSHEDSDNPAEWGVGVRQVESNMRAYLEHLKAGIRKRASDLANDPHLGVAYALSLLRELKAVLRNEHFLYLQHFDGAVAQWRDEVQHQSFAFDQLQLDIARHDRELLFRAEDLKLDMERLAGDKDAPDPGVLYSYLYSRVMKQVAKRGKQICEEVDKFLGKDDPTGGGLLGEYYSLLAGFSKLKDRLGAKVRYFEKPDTSELNLSLHRDGDSEVWYRTWLGDAEQEREALQRVGNQLLKNIFKVDSVTAALAAIQRTPADEVEQRMLAECVRFLAGKPEQPEALSLLLDGSRFTQKQREEMVRRAYNLGKVWLTRAEVGIDHAGLQPVRADQRPCLIGIDTGNVARLQEFKSLLQQIQSPGDTPPTLLNIGEANKGMIVFYNELAGVPAFYPTSVTAPTGLRKAYDAYKDKDELHTDKNRFQFGDLIPKTADEARWYAESLKAFVLGRLLGLLKVREIRDQVDMPTYHYSYKREVGISVEEVFLGDELHAVDYLYRDKRPEPHTDRRQLLSQVEGALEVLQRRHMLWTYGLLLEFYLKLVYPPARDEKWGDDLSITQYSPQYAVLGQAQTEIRQLLPAEEEWRQFANALVARRGKPLGEPLGYDEYVAALSPYGKEVGKFPVSGKSAVGIDRIEFKPVLALDMEKIVPPQEPPKQKPAAPPQVEAEVAAPKRERRCPNCAEPIDARAVYCRHCKRTVAQHVTCPHCHEARVPDDLDFCWNCGSRMEKGVKKECPRCFSFSGFESQFPCPVCGYSLDNGAETPPQAPPEETGRDPEGGTAAPSPGTPPGAGAGPAASSAAPPPGARARPEDDRPRTAEQETGTTGAAAAPSGAPSPPPGVATTARAGLIECPHCMTMVKPGPRCGECGGLLEIH